MACLDMYNQNNERKGHGTPLPMSPRISFSNDFVESTTNSSSHHHNLHQQIMKMAYRDAPVSSDFEFSVSNYSMMSADELFSQGKLLPFKQSCSNSNSQMQKGTTTLRDELLAGDNEDAHFSLKPPKTSTRWRGLLGLKKSNLGSKKIDKNERSSSSSYEDVHATKNSQEPCSRDFEFRF